jgi:hypothetical protein
VMKDADGRIKLDRKRATDKIDGIYATMLAIDRLNRNEHGASAYEDGDLVVVSTLPEGTPAPSPVEEDHEW